MSARRNQAPERTLAAFGYAPFFADALSSARPELQPARVLLARGEFYRVVSETGENDARVAGRVKHEAARATDLPAVGDWVGLAEGQIEWVFPRRTRLSRKVPGKRAREQIVAANVDLVVIVMGLDADYSERRLERYLTTVWESGAAPLVLLNKADLNESFEARAAAVRDLAAGAPVVTSSMKTGLGVDELTPHLRARETAVLVGSSGVGKSTLINRLLGSDIQQTRSVRERDERGQHTTTHRELFLLPGGALLIDNPGIRELQLWADESALEQSFDDVVALAKTCRFNDCGHDAEPGCAVAEAVSTGELPEERLESFRALQKEVRFLARRQDETAERVEKQKWRTIHKEMRKSGKHRRT